VEVVADSEEVAVVVAEITISLTTTRAAVKAERNDQEDEVAVDVVVEEEVEVAEVDEVVAAADEKADPEAKEVSRLAENDSRRRRRSLVRREVGTRARDRTDQRQ
jgi:hypothetical protein